MHFSGAEHNFSLRTRYFLRFFFFGFNVFCVYSLQLDVLERASIDVFINILVFLCRPLRFDFRLPPPLPSSSFDAGLREKRTNNTKNMY